MNQNDQLDLLLHWTRNVKRAQFGHYRLAHRYRRLYTFIGVFVTVISGIGGSTLMADVSKYFPTSAAYFNVAVGAVLLLAAVMSGIQTLLRLDERAQQHRTAAASYSAAKRQLDQLVVMANNGAVSAARLDDVRQLLDELTNGTPQIPDRLLKKIEKHMPPTPFEEYYAAKKSD